MEVHATDKESLSSMSPLQDMDASNEDQNECHHPLINRLKRITEENMIYADTEPTQEPLKIDVNESPGSIVAKEMHIHHHSGTGLSLLDNFKARTKATIDQFNMGGFFTTRAANRAKKLLVYGYVCLEGNDVSGKTSLGMYLLSLFAMKGFVPLILNNPDEYSYVSMNEQYVLFIDDIFGQREIFKELACRWSKVLDGMFQMIKSGNLYLIIASKDGLIDKSQQWINLDEFFDKGKRIRLQHPDLSLRDYERVAILDKLANQLLKRHCFPPDCRIYVHAASVSNHPWFLLCCKHLARRPLPLNDWPEYFKHPISILYQKITLLKETEPVKLAALVLIMKYGHLFGTESHNITDEEVELLSTLLSLYQQPTKSDIKNAVLSLTGEFISCSSEGKCTFLHSTVEEAVAFVFWEVAPIFSIRWCPLDFLINHTTVDNVTQNTLRAVRIDRHLYEELITRFYKSPDLQFLKHSVFKNHDVVHMFLSNNPHINDKLVVVGILGVSAVLGHAVLLREVIGIWRNFETSEQNEVEHFVLEIACRSGHVETVKELIDAGITPCKSCYTSACGSSHTTDILALFPKTVIPEKADEVTDASLTGLIASNARVDITTLLKNMAERNDGQCLAYRGMVIAGKKGQLEMYTLFENEHTDEIADNSQILNNVIQGGNLVIMSLLLHKLEHKSVVNERTFLLACHYNRKEIAALIWDEANVYTRSIIFEHVGYGFPALQIASMISGADSQLFDWMLAEGFPVNGRGPTGQTPLHTACISGNLKATKKLLEKGSDIAAVDDEGNTALHLHCSSDQPRKDIVEILLDAKANICALNKENKTALHMLCEKQYQGRSTVMYLLISKGTPVNTTDKDGHTPLHLLLKTGFCLEEEELLLENDATVNIKSNLQETPIHAVSRSHNLRAVQMIAERNPDLRARDKHGAFCLHHAVTAMNNGDVVKYLLQQEIPSNIADNNGNTILHVAVQIPHNEEVVSLLLNAGADPTLTNDNGYTPVHIVCEEANESCLAYLNEILRNKAAVLNPKGKYLHLACGSNGKYGLDIVQKLLNEGAGINYRDESGKTALHFVCEKSSKVCFYIAQELCAREAVLDAPDTNGNTPLHAACYSHGDYRVKVILLLVNQGAKVTVKNRNLTSPVMLMQEQGNEDLFPVMIDKILNQACMTEGKYTVDDVDEALAMEIQWSTLYNDAKPILHRICSVHGEHSPIIVTKLLEQGVDVTEKEKDGMTVIHLACLSIGPWTEALLATLIACDVDTLAVDTLGQTALHKAIESEDSNTENVLNQLLKSGLHPNIPDRNGNTPLHLVCGSKGPYTRDRLHWLLQNGADPEYMNNSGETPYDLVSHSPDTKQALMDEILLHYSTTVNILDQNKIISLQKMGANINCRDKEGNTILHLLVLDVTRSRRMHTKDNIKLMKSFGADLTETNNADKTAYEVALHQGMREDILTLLCPNLEHQKKTMHKKDAQMTCSELEKPTDDVLDNLADKVGILKDATKDLIGTAAGAVAKGVRKIFD